MYFSRLPLERIAHFVAVMIYITPLFLLVPHSFLMPSNASRQRRVGATPAEKNRADRCVRCARKLDNQTIKLRRLLCWLPSPDGFPCCRPWSRLRGYLQRPLLSAIHLCVMCELKLPEQIGLKCNSQKRCFVEWDHNNVFRLWKL